MQIQPLAIPDVKLITPQRYCDERGFFSETFNAQKLNGLGIKDSFVQDNHSRSRCSGVIRGLHFQIPPHAQGKLLRVVRGSIFDVAVDIRAGSPTFGRHVTATLSATNWCQLWVPPGFAHGLCTLEPGTEVLYKVTDYYVPECDRGLRWNDPHLGIVWPVAAANAVLSMKDRLHPCLAELPTYFRHRETYCLARRDPASTQLPD